MTMKQSAKFIQNLIKLNPMASQEPETYRLKKN